ncbi:MAG: hypothetical protein DRI61_04080, partial [Chloroflexi bacterium]
MAFFWLLWLALFFQPFHHVFTFILASIFSVAWGESMGNLRKYMVAEKFSYQYDVEDVIELFFGFEFHDVELGRDHYGRDYYREDVYSSEEEIEEEIRWALEELGLDEGATMEEIKRRYRKLVREYHPDAQCVKTEEERKETEEKFKRIIHAYQILKRYYQNSSSSIKNDTTRKIKMEMFSEDVMVSSEEVKKAEKESLLTIVKGCIAVVVNKSGLALAHTASSSLKSFWKRKIIKIGGILLLLMLLQTVPLEITHSILEIGVSIFSMYLIYYLCCRTERREEEKFANKDNDSSSSSLINKKELEDKFGVVFKFAEKLDVPSQYLERVINLIKRYGFENTCAVVSKIKVVKEYQGLLPCFDWENIEELVSLYIIHRKGIFEFEKAKELFGEEKILPPQSFEKNWWRIDNPISGLVVIFPSLLEYYKNSLALILYPEERLKFREGRKIRVEHIKNSFAYVVFRRIYKRSILIVEIQTDVWGDLTHSYKKRLKNWPELMINLMEKFAQKHKIENIFITPESYQLKRWINLPENIAKRIYQQAPQNLGYRLIRLSETILLEGYKIDTLYTKKISSSSLERTISLLRQLQKENPSFFRILKESNNLEEARRAVFDYLGRIEEEILWGYRKIRDIQRERALRGIEILKEIISPLREAQVGFSTLELLYGLIKEENKELFIKEKKIEAGFIEEFIYLLRAIRGESPSLHPRIVFRRIRNLLENIPADYEGRRLGVYYSSLLDILAEEINREIDKFICGLHPEIIRQREISKEFILKYFGGIKEDWDNWRWHMRHIIKDRNTLENLIYLREEEKEAVDLAVTHKLPFKITPYYLSLMDYYPSGRDASLRAQVIPSLYYVKKVLSVDKSPEEMDFMKESETSPQDLITRRYPLIVILKLSETCPQICVYCQRNWELMNPQFLRVEATYKESLAKAIKFLEMHSQIREVLLTGGEPLIRSDQYIEKVLKSLSKMSHLRRIRIGSRIFVTLPQRVTSKLAEMISKFHNPPQREMCMVTHIQHPYEITPQMVKAVQSFLRRGIKVYNQQVFTFYNSRYFETASLMFWLRLIGVEPYYVFNAKGKEETFMHRVPIARLMQVLDEVRLLPGMERTARAVFNIPGIGKVNLTDKRCRKLIGIHPDGSRIYQFMHWGQNLFSDEIYIYKDVSISSYLDRLKEIGENPKDYETIWYYDNGGRLTQESKNINSSLITFAKRIRFLLDFDEKANSIFIKKILSSLKEYLPVDVSYVFLSTSLSFSSIRELYRKMIGEKEDNEEIVFLITDKDLKEDYIFGRSWPYKGVGVVSLYHLYSSDKILYKERAMKVILHEIGHLFGLAHCRQNCIMRFSATVKSLDKVNLEFCCHCKRLLK